MEHITELVRPGVDALLVPTGLPAGARVAQLLAHVEALVDRPSMLRRMQRSGWERASTGPLSLARRDEALLSRYAAMKQRTARIGRGAHPPAQPVAAPPVPGTWWLEVGSRELAEGYRVRDKAGRRVRVVQTSARPAAQSEAGDTVRC